jgi:hypothetical protein
MMQTAKRFAIRFDLRTRMPFAGSLCSWQIDIIPGIVRTLRRGEGGRLAHACESYPKSSTIEPSEPDGNLRLGFEHVGLCQVFQFGVAAVSG